MMTDEQKSTVAGLKRAIAAATREDGAPREVHRVVVSLKRELRRTGTTARELAAALGVHESTLCRWEREVGSDVGVAARNTMVAGGSAKAPEETADGRRRRRGRAGPKRKDRAARFRMIEVTTPAKPAAVVTSARLAAQSLRVAHAPSGLVVDGLDVETLAVLLRRMS
jgi:hypothetical protein